MVFTDILNSSTGHTCYFPSIPCSKLGEEERIDSKEMVDNKQREDREIFRPTKYNIAGARSKALVVYPNVRVIQVRTDRTPVNARTFFICLPCQVEEFPIVLWWSREENRAYL